MIFKPNLCFSIIAHNPSPVLRSCMRDLNALFHTPTHQCWQSLSTLSSSMQRQYRKKNLCVTKLTLNTYIRCIYYIWIMVFDPSWLLACFDLTEIHVSRSDEDWKALSMRYKCCETVWISLIITIIIIAITSEVKWQRLDFWSPCSNLGRGPPHLFWPSCWQHLVKKPSLSLDQ